MPDISIHNETEFPLTASILEQIKRDALEYFGDSVRSIKVQYGIERHAFNARTGEIRYAFSPGDFGLLDTSASIPDPYFSRDVPRIDDDTDDTDDADEEIDEISYDEVEGEEDNAAETSLEDLDEDLDNVDEEEAASLDDLSGSFSEINDDDDEDEDDEEFMYSDDEYD